MKNFLTTILFVSVGFLIGTSSTFALSFFDTGGNPYNPLYIQIEQDPFQQQMQQDKAQSSANTQKENYLKSTYGLSNYYDCSSSSLSKSDFGDPRTKASDLIAVQYCLERKSLNESSAPPTIQVDSYGRHDDQCFSQFGYRSVFNNSSKKCECMYGTEIGKNSGQCVPIKCASGYEREGDECVSTPKTPPTLTNDEICQSSYANTHWDGTTNDTGGLNCECASGYYKTPNAECALMPKNTTTVTKTKPIETPKVQTPVAKKVTDIEKEVSLQNTKDQACIETYGEHSLSKNGGCGCMVGYSMAVNGENVETGCVLETVNEQKTAVEAPRIETPIQHKSLWARIKSWFGFN